MEGAVTCWHGRNEVAQSVGTMIRSMILAKLRPAMLKTVRLLKIDRSASRCGSNAKQTAFVFRG